MKDVCGEEIDFLEEGLQQVSMNAQSKIDRCAQHVKLLVGKSKREWADGKLI